MALYRSSNLLKGISFPIKATHSVNTYYDSGGLHVITTYLPTGEQTQSHNVTFYGLQISQNTSTYDVTFSLTDGTYYARWAEGLSEGLGFYKTQTQTQYVRGTTYFACNLNIVPTVSN